MKYVLREGKLVPIERVQPNPVVTVVPDLPAYRSPIDGCEVSGRRARREDLARHQCRPYEGKESELRESNRQAQYDEARIDRHIDETARKAYYQLRPDLRAELEGRK